MLDLHSEKKQFKEGNTSRFLVLEVSVYDQMAPKLSGLWQGIKHHVRPQWQKSACLKVTRIREIEERASDQIESSVSPL